LFHPDTDGSEIVARFNLQGKIICGFVGTFGAWHGVEVLARAVKPTIQRNPYIHFLIIGEGTLRGEIERILRSDGVEEFVTLTGSVPHTEIPKHLGACEILLSPHVQNTDGTVFFGSPTKLFEYLGMGKAIVASSVGQIGEIMIDGQNCLLMKHRDHEDLAEKILYLVEHPDLRVKLGATARKNAIEMFSWQRNAQNVINAVQPFLRQ
jgi:glycosyltransferase involved in cell wall biosynthesis